MIRFMIDTDQLAALTGHAELLATYADLVTDLPAFQARYPHSEIILIDRGIGDPTGMASVFDIEQGALDLPAARAHYEAQASKGIRFLTVYHDRAIADEVKAAFAPHMPYHWYATLDGTAHIAGYVPLEGPVAVQCLSSADLGYHADGSLVFEDSWHPTRTVATPQLARQLVANARGQVVNMAGDLSKLAAVIGG